jgi:myo-inositol-1(or 4)-monophosphatase
MKMGDRGLAPVHLQCRSRGLIAHRSTLARRSIRQMDVFSADWLAICRRIVAAQREIFAATPGSAERTVYEGVGEGGDHTLAIDRRCEDVVFDELEQLAAAGASFVAVSEERGEVEFGSGGSARVVIDPIDGSLNARRTIPSHSLSIAVASGPTMAGVEFGFVHDFGADEEFAARRGGGATLDDRPIAVAAAAERLEVVGLESAEPGWALPALEALEGKAYRLRVVGSLAITAAYVAAGRFDAMLSLRACRSVDIAAAHLIVREAGGATAFGELELEQVPLDLDARYVCAAARDDAGLEVVLAAQSAGDPA